MSRDLDWQGVFAEAYDPAAHDLSTTEVVGVPTTTAHLLDANGIMRSVYDPDTMTIRVIVIP